MGRGANRKKFILSYVVFLIILIAIIVFGMLQIRADRKKRATAMAKQISGYIQTRILSMANYSDVLSAWLDVEGDEYKKALADPEKGKEYVSDFEKVAEALFDETSMSSVQLIPDGVIRYVYPTEGNEPLVDMDLSKEPEAEQLTVAASSGELAITGPTFVSKVGLGLNFRMPVYYENGDLWGYTALTMPVPESLESLALSRLVESGYKYELRYIQDEANGKTERIGGTNTRIKNAVEIPFEVQDKTWILYLLPEDGWVNIGLVVGIIIIAFLVAFVLASGFVFLRTHQEEKMSQLRSDAKHDKMTGLLNHTASAEAINAALEGNEGGVLLLIDVDNFKTVNDTAGHVAGDEVLVEVASAMRTTFRRHDILGRYGGDEFIVYMVGDVSIPDFSVKASQFQRKIRKIPIGNTGNFVTCSIGGARRCIETPDAETLVNRADKALYTSKGAGKDRFTIFDDSGSTVIVSPKVDESKLDHDFLTRE